ncbi:hypothetical protein M8J77_025194 [Diaphorina citri]|nr:hypothetical protein M8J77_025194 [Diaphorina citri]
MFFGDGVSPSIWRQATRLLTLTSLILGKATSTRLSRWSPIRSLTTSNVKHNISELWGSGAFSELSPLAMLNGPDPTDHCYEEYELMKLRN